MMSFRGHIIIVFRHNRLNTTRSIRRSWSIGQKIANQIFEPKPEVKPSASDAGEMWSQFLGPYKAAIRTASTVEELSNLPKEALSSYLMSEDVSFNKNSSRGALCELVVNTAKEIRRKKTKRKKNKEKNKENKESEEGRQKKAKKSKKKKQKTTEVNVRRIPEAPGDEKCDDEISPQPSLSSTCSSHSPVDITVFVMNHQFQTAMDPLSCLHLARVLFLRLSLRDPDLVLFLQILNHDSDEHPSHSTNDVRSSTPHGGDYDPIRGSR